MNSRLRINQASAKPTYVMVAEPLVFDEKDQELAQEPVKTHRVVARTRKERRSKGAKLSKHDLQALQAFEAEQATIQRLHALQTRELGTDGQTTPWEFDIASNGRRWTKVTIPVVTIQVLSASGGIVNNVITSAGWTASTDYTAIAGTWEVCRTKSFQAMFQPLNQYDSGLTNITQALFVVSDLENATPLTATTGTPGTSADEYADTLAICTSNNAWSKKIEMPTETPFDTLDTLATPVARAWIKLYQNSFAASQVLGYLVVRYQLELFARA